MFHSDEFARRCPNREGSTSNAGLVLCSKSIVELRKHLPTGVSASCICSMKYKLSIFLWLSVTMCVFVPQYMHIPVYTHFILKIPCIKQKAAIKIFFLGQTESLKISEATGQMNPASSMYRSSISSYLHTWLVKHHL